MKLPVLFVLLNEYADWEGAYIAPNLYSGIAPGSESPFTVKTVSLTKEPIKSLGGFTLIPDYDINNVPQDYAAIILIGGNRWLMPEAELVVPLIKDAIKNNKLVAGICNASVFLGRFGFLNNVKHTSNGLEYLKAFGAPDYNGENLYCDTTAVCDGNIVTAGGLAPLEFSREILLALKAYSEAKIEQSFRMYKTGVWEAPIQE